MDGKVQKCWQGMRGTGHGMFLPVTSLTMNRLSILYAARHYLVPTSIQCYTSNEPGETFTTYYLLPPTSKG